MVMRMLAVIRQLHDVRKIFMRLDGGKCSDMLDMKQGLREGCVLAPLLFNMFFTAVRRGTEKRFLADEDILNNMVELQPK